MNVLDTVRQIVAELHNLPVEEVTPETDFFADLGDSLNFTENILACEEAFAIEIPDDEFESEQITTVGGLAAFIQHKIDGGKIPGDGPSSGV